MAGVGSETVSLGKQLEGGPRQVAEEPNPPGYHLDTGPYMLELYRLLCMVVADQRIAKIGCGVDSAISRLRDEYVYNELKRTLISSAIALRICLDESHTRR